MISLIETCQIEPYAGDGLPEMLLPLTYLDLPWVMFHPIRRLLFYRFPCSVSDFLQTHLPEVKKSLSLTLKHYTPVAGNLLVYPPTDSRKPEIRYLPGDSVLLSVYESGDDFDSLVGYGIRDADEFYDCVPQLPPIREESEFKIVPLLAVQVTLFPWKGICIGVTNHHCVGDANSVVSFIKAWASIQLAGSDEQLEQKPCFDRRLINDPKGIDSIFWNVLKEIPLKSSIFPLPTKRVRATFTINGSEIKKLKDFVSARRPGLVHLSSFVVASAYAWTIFTKSEDVTCQGEVLDEKQEEYFGFSMDARSRLDSELPANYFGNCLGFGFVKMKRSELVGEDGFLVAAEAIAVSIQDKVKLKGKLLDGAENWMTEYGKSDMKKIFSISGSPKFDLYDVDFGLGKVVKFESVSIDEDQCSISLCKSPDFLGGLEIGLSLPKDTMEAITALFASGLNKF